MMLSILTRQRHLQKWLYATQTRERNLGIEGMLPKQRFLRKVISSTAASPLSKK